MVLRRPTQWFVLLLIVGLLPAAPAAGAAQSVGTTPGHFEPPVARDLAPQADVVRVQLTAQESRVHLRDGPATKMWTLNGSVPAPTIEADVGDHVVVEFCNDLPADAGEATLHWHGLEVPATQDGSNISQAPVARGECFDYEFDALRAATYWYHSHIDSNVHVEMGLHGALIIRDPAEDARLGLPADTMLVLDDVLLTDDNQVAPPLPDDPLARAKTLLDGREGDTLLVNGRADRVLNVRRGEPQRWRLVNVSNARFMRVSIPGHVLWRVGGDAGLVEHPERIMPAGHGDGHGGHSGPDPEGGLLLVPGERAEVVYTPTGRAGSTIAVEWHDFPRGRHAPFLQDDGTIGLDHAHDDGQMAPRPLMHIRLTGGPPRDRAYTPPATLRPVEPIDVTGAEIIPSTFGHTPPDPQGDVTFFAARKNGMPLPFPAVTPADAPDAQVGEVRVYEVTNLTGSDHPFHAHGFFFQPLEIEFVDMDNPENNRVVPFDEVEWKDTIRLPGRPGAAMRSRTILRAAVVFDDTGREGQVEAFGKTPTPTRSGGWVFHCHILEHADKGMMSFLELRDP